MLVACESVPEVVAAGFGEQLGLLGEPGVVAFLVAETVRLVLVSGAYRAGQGGRGWESLDAGILELARVRGEFALENPSRAGAVLDMARVGDPLESLIAIPVAHEDEFLGALWLGYRSPRTFAASETKLLSIFASQLGLSLANVREVL